MSLRELLGDATPPATSRDRVRAGVARRLTRARRIRVAASAGLLVALVVTTAALWPRPGEAPPGVRLNPGDLTLASSRILIGADSYVRLLHDGPDGTTLRLHRGTLTAHVQKRAPGHEFVVLAARTRVEVVGTVFTVTLVDGDPRVTVAEGTVRVITDEGTTLLDAPAPPAAPAPPPAPSPAPTTTPAPAPSPPPAPAPARAATAEPEARREAEREPEPEPEAEAEPEAEPSAFARAKQLESSGATEQALRAYLALAATSDPHAEDASFAAARLMRDPTRALDQLRAHRARWPNSRYARAVATRILDLLIAAGDQAAVDAEADAFLKAYPDDPRAPRFRAARSKAD